MAEAIEIVAEWWADVFGISRSRLWQQPSIRPHTVLGEYDGWYVAWRGDVHHASAPPAADLGAEPAEAVPAEADAAAWRSFAERHRQRLIGPSVHAYLTSAPPSVPQVQAVSQDALVDLESEVLEGEWTESGFAGLVEGDLCFALMEGSRIVAAANLTDFAGKPRDVGLLVTPDARGRGLGRLVAQHAAAYAVRHHGIARWRARVDNAPSLAVARSLGFETYCTQLAVRP